MAFIKASVDLTVDLLKWLNSLKLTSAAAVKKKTVLKKKKMSRRPSTICLFSLGNIPKPTNIQFTIT